MQSSFYNAAVDLLGRNLCGNSADGIAVIDDAGSYTLIDGD
jgi:hypothetical protein